MTMDDIYPFIAPAFFGAILIASIAMLWQELTRDITPSSKGDE